MIEIIWKDEVFAIIGAAIEVHRELGSAFLEPVYQEALEIELARRGIPFKPQETLKIHYKGTLLKKSYVADLICFDKIIVELKAMENLTPREESQVLNYLSVSQLKVGVLINFGAVGRLEWRRFVM